MEVAEEVEENEEEDQQEEKEEQEEEPEEEQEEEDVEQKLTAIEVRLAKLQQLSSPQGARIQDAGNGDSTTVDLEAARKLWKEEHARTSAC